MYYIGVDLGGTNIAIGIVDENGEIIRKSSVRTNSKREADEIVKDMAELALGLVEQQGIALKDIKEAGIATPGTVNHDQGFVIYANNLPMRDYPLAAKFSEYTGIKNVLIENDGNAAAKGEAIRGASKGCNNSIMITLGTGVGGGIIIDKKIYSGFNYSAGELGHVVIEVGGRKCTCGREGCWEAYSSATGLINMTKEEMLRNKDSLMWELCDGNIQNVSGRTAFDAMRKNDKSGKAVVDMYLGYLAAGIVNMINIFQPEVIVIGGGLSNERNYLLEPMAQTIEKEQYTRDNEIKTQIKIAELGNDAGIIGAAMLGC